MTSSITTCHNPFLIPPDGKSVSQKHARDRFIRWTIVFQCIFGGSVGFWIARALDGKSHVTLETELARICVDVYWLRWYGVHELSTLLAGSPLLNLVIWLVEWCCPVKLYNTVIIIESIKCLIGCQTQFICSCSNLCLVLDSAHLPN